MVSKEASVHPSKRISLGSSCSLSAARFKSGRKLNSPGWASFLNTSTSSQSLLMGGGSTQFLETSLYGNRSIK